MTRTFTGQVLDAETGLMLYRNRVYHPTLGRFVQRDPVGYDAEDMNLYRYVGNMLSLFVDPMGLSKVKVIYRIGGVVKRTTIKETGEATSKLKAITKDATKPKNQRKYTADIFVQCESNCDAKRLAEAVSPSGEAVFHPKSLEGYPAHYHPVKSKSSGGNPKTEGTPHIGSDYTGAGYGMGLLIIDFTPAGDIKTIVMEGPELVSASKETIALLAKSNISIVYDSANQCRDANRIKLNKAIVDSALNPHHFDSELARPGGRVIFPSWLMWLIGK